MTHLANTPAVLVGYSHPCTCLLPKARMKLHIRGTRSGQSRGFTLIELIAAVLILALLVATFVPYALSLREKSSRIRCATR